MREEGDSRYSHSSPKLMTNDECHALFGCHVVPECFRKWAVGFVHGQSVSCMAFVFLRGHPFSCMGDRFRAWATVFMCGQPSSCVVVVSVHGRLFPCVGGQLDVWVVVGVGGVIVVHGVVVLWGRCPVFQLGR